MSPTHSFDSGQRLVALDIATRDSDTLQVTVTPYGLPSCDSCAARG